jgi:glycosyltransferase involved in cell wall biosynthesis
MQTAMEKPQTAGLHSSIRENPDLGKYAWSSCKYYYLPLHAQARFASPLAEEILGCANGEDRTPEGLHSSLLKAARGGFSHVKIPLDRAGSPLISSAFAMAAEAGIPVVLQLSSALLREPAYRDYVYSLPAEFEAEIILEEEGPLDPGQLADLRTRFRGVHLSILVHKHTRWPAVLPKELVPVCGEVHLYFAYQLEPGTPYLTCLESHWIFRKLRALAPEVRFLPPKGVDIWDHRVKRGFELEPFLLPCFSTESANPQVKYSVVIPTYNNQNHLRVTLRHLFAQDVGPDAFEIIIVDDGSTDQTQCLVTELLGRQAARFNFKYIYFPREKRRSMGDAQFRAGIARNLGVKNAAGEILCFLDSDIVTPPHYLRVVEEQLKHWDALQARRVNLKQKVSHLECNFAEVVAGRDTDPDEAYWESFIKSTRDWHLLPYNWKYVCTHSFSMRKDLFLEIGGFKRNFIFYGFEDTDLGYRITKSGRRLHLLDLTVFHLFHENTRSEFRNLKSLRHDLLSRTAQIFYLHHLDDDIFENLRGFMNPELTFARLWSRIRNFLTLSVIWKARPEVYSSLPALEKGLRQ